MSHWVDIPWALYSHKGGMSHWVDTPYLTHIRDVGLPNPESKFAACVCRVVPELPKGGLVRADRPCVGGTRGKVIQVIPADGKSPAIQQHNTWYSCRG